MPPTTRRGPGKRLVLILAALASIVAGYYLGQYWQRRPLAELTAVVYPAGQRIDYPADLGIDNDPGVSTPWRLFLAVDTGAPACSRLLRHYASVINRLAAWPEIQAQLRLTLLAYDRPDAAAVTAFSGGASWVEVLSAETQSLDRLSGQLGILPDPGNWCAETQANAILVAPDRTSWALIPHEQAAMMAHNIRTIIAFVE